MSTWLQISRSPEYSPAKLSESLLALNEYVNDSGLDTLELFDKASKGETIIHGGYINTELIASKSILAEHISVEDLSAISADIGEVTSGKITGATIRTSSSGDRLELSNQSFKAYESNTKRVEFEPDNITFYDQESRFGGEVIAVPAKDAYDDPMIMMRTTDGLVYVGSNNPWDTVKAGMRIIGIENPTEVPNLSLQVRDSKSRDSLLYLSSNTMLLRSSETIQLSTPTIKLGGTISPILGNVEVERGFKILPSNSAFFGISTNNKSLIEFDTEGIIFNNRIGNNVLDYHRSDSNWAFWRDVIMDRDLNVYGSKNSIEKTTNYGERLINAYETAEYYFGDIGSGIIGEDGECVIYIDDIFQETINTKQNYHVFTQINNGDICGIEKYENYFIVKGEKDTKFSWELKAKRKGYEDSRLEQPNKFKHDEFNTFNDELVHKRYDIENRELDDELENMYLKVHELEYDLENNLSNILLEG